MTIRLAQLTDVPAIMNMVRRAVPQMQAAGNFQWDDTYPNEAVFEDDIAKAQLWMAGMDGQLAGISATTTDQYAEYAEVGWDLAETAIVTHRLVVDPAFRGRGIGKALLQQAEVVARQRGISVLRVDTNTKNAASQSLFPTVGYMYAGEIGLAFRPGLRFCCYEKRI